MVNTKAVRVAIYQRLNVASVTSLLGSGSASLAHEVAQPTAAYPLCVFHKQAGTVTDLAMSGDAFKDHVWLVKGIAKGDPGTSASPAEDIDKAVNDLLHYGDLTISGASDLFLARESDVEYTETDGDVQYRHVGGLYRLRLHS